MPWSPLAAGFLTGKYTREEAGASGQGRLSGPNPFGDTKFTERNWRTLDTLKAVAAQGGCPPAQVALAWAVAQPGVTSLLLGASRLEQLQDNLASLEVSLNPEQLRALNAASVFDPSSQGFFTHELRRLIFGDQEVAGWH